MRWLILRMQKQCIVFVGTVNGQERLIYSLLEEYDKMHFINSNCSYNQTACAVYQLEVLVRNGLKVVNEFQKLGNVVVYPSEVFAPRSLLGDDINITKNTYSIHHYSSTCWDENASKGMRELKENLGKYRKRLKENE